MTCLLSDRAQKLVVREHKHHLAKISEDYWNHSVIQMPNSIKINYKYKAKEILKKYDIKTIIELTHLLTVYQNNKAGTCQFCKKDYYEYRNRTGTNNTFCGCKGICSKCNKIYKHEGETENECFECCYKKENLREDEQIKRNNNIFEIAFIMKKFDLLHYKNTADVEKVIDIMTQRLKYLQQYLIFYNQMDD